MGRVLICGERVLTRAVAREYLADVPASLVEGLHHLEDASPTGRIVIACLPTIQPPTLHTLWGEHGSRPWVDIILVTSVVPSHMRMLAPYSQFLRYLVGLDELGTKLRRQVDELLNVHFLSWAADRLVRSSHLSPITARFVGGAWQAARPALTVKRTSYDNGIRLSTLRDHWSMEVKPMTVIDWGILGRAQCLRRAGVAWPQVAQRLGLTQRRLARICVRCVSHGLEVLDERGDAWLEARFLAWLSREALPSAFPRGTAA